MPSAQRFCLIGVRPVEESGWFDAFDAIVELDDGDLVCFGARAPEALNAPSRPDIENQPWGDYQPIPVTLNFATVRHYDFNAPLWLGPTPRPCLVWTNAVALNADGVAAILRYANQASENGILAGEGGSGLPHPDELGIETPADGRWYEVPAS